jgi:hypothetical protein
LLFAATEASPWPAVLWSTLAHAARDAVEVEARSLPLPVLEREIEVVRET